MQIKVKTFRVCRKRAVHAGDVVGSQAWVDRRTKTNVAPKNIHTLFFLVVRELEDGMGKPTIEFGERGVGLGSRVKNTKRIRELLFICWEIFF